MHTSRPPRAGSASARSYATGILLGLAVSLSLMLVLARLPVYPLKLERSVWGVSDSRETISVREIRQEARSQASPEVPVTFFTPDEAIPDAGQDDETAEAEIAETPAAQPEVLPSRAQSLSRAVLQFSEQMPQVAGGMGAYYINIEYPEEAQRAGIQGRVILDFIVEADGKATDITVIQSLHPLCDSAAVRALRATNFIPGRQGGEHVRVRMRLPVRFRLVASASEIPNG